MARAHMTFFRPEEIDKIHNASTRILEEIGILVPSESVAKILVDAGAIRSEDGRRLCLSETMVKEALTSAPKSIILAGRNEVRDIQIPSEKELYVAPGGEAVQVKDLIEGTKRTPTLKDYLDVLTIVESLPQIDFFWGLVGALEFTNRDMKGVTELSASFQYTSKHIQGGSHSAEDAKRQIEMAAIVSGSEKELSRRPIISCIQCPISPLQFEKGYSEAQVILARAGIPIVSMSASMAGLTSPVTISGTIAQINAENLASLVISQTARKGAPFIYSSDSVPADLRGGHIDYGAIEAELMRTAAGQMGRHYRLPVMCAGMGIGQLSQLIGSLKEGMYYMIIESMVPSDLASGLGSIDQAAGASLEQLILDAWIWEIAKEMIREFETSDDAISIETVREALKDGFLTKKHTMTRYRNEFSITRHPEAIWRWDEKEVPRGFSLNKAHEELKRILSKPKAKVVSEDVSKQLDSIVGRVRKNVSS